MEENVDNIRYLYSDSAWYEDNQIWVSVMEFNGLFQYDMNKGSTRFIGSFPGEETYIKRLHGRTLKIKNEIYFLPDNSKYVHVYNLETNAFSFYDVGIKGRIACRNGVYYGDSIYFICGGTEIVVCSINIETKKIKKQKIEIDNFKYGIGSDVVLIEDKFYFTCKYPNVVIEYSCREDTYKKFLVGKKGEGFGTICYDGEDFWLSGKTGIVRWNKSLADIIEYDNYPNGFGMCIRPSLNSEQIEFIPGFSNKYSESETPFWFSAYFDRKVWLFPGRTNMIICVDIHTGSMEEFCLEDELEDEISLLAKHRCTHCHYLGGRQNNTLIFFSTKSKKIRVIDQNRTNIREFYLKCKEPNDLSLYLSNGKLDVRHEDKELNSLEEFLAIVKGS